MNDDERDVTAGTAGPGGVADDIRSSGLGASGTGPLDESGVRALLGSLSAPTMPVAVVARLDRALAQEAARTLVTDSARGAGSHPPTSVTPLTGRRRRNPLPALAAAAAVIVVAAVGFSALQAGGSSESASTAASMVPQDAGAPPAVASASGEAAPLAEDPSSASKGPTSRESPGVTTLESLDRADVVLVRSGSAYLSSDLAAVVAPPDAAWRAAALAPADDMAATDARAALACAASLGATPPLLVDAPTLDGNPVLVIAEDNPAGRTWVTTIGCSVLADL